VGVVGAVGPVADGAGGGVVAVAVAHARAALGLAVDVDHGAAAAGGVAVAGPDVLELRAGERGGGGGEEEGAGEAEPHDRASVCFVCQLMQQTDPYIVINKFAVLW